jgi:hypothetical protein
MGIDLPSNFGESICFVIFHRLLTLGRFYRVIEDALDIELHFYEMRE